MIKEEQERDQVQIKSATESATSNHVKAASERDAARAAARDLEQQLAAALADLDLARADRDRAVTASSNMQNALEAFQIEREAETAILEEQRRDAEVAAAAAHAAVLEATIEADEAKMREVQIAADKAVTNIMEEVNDLEQRVNVSLIAFLICVEGQGSGIFVSS